MALLGMLSIAFPDVAALPLWAAGLAVFWYVWSSIMTWYRLRHIPGPWLARFSYLWHGYYAFSGRGGPVYAALHDRYAGGGPFVRIAPNYVVTNDPEVLRGIMAARTRYTRHEWFQGAQFHLEYGNMITLRDNDEHDSMKAKTAGSYSGREAGAAFEPAIDAQIAALVSLIRRKFLSTTDELRVAELTTLMRYFTLDVITCLGYGATWGHLAEGDDVTGFVTALNTVVKYVALVADMPLLRRIMFSRTGLALLGPKVTDERGTGRVMGMIEQIVSERFQQKDKKTWNDMIGGFIRNGLTQQEVIGEACLQIFAGSETTASTLAAIVMYLAATPRAYVRLKCEIRDAIGRGDVAADCPVTYDQAQRLPYLQAVLWEGFRMRPPVNYGHYKAVPPGGDTICGVFLPGGTAIGHNGLALTRNAAIFGRDVDVFRPERFLAPECDDETRACRFRGLDILFGGGRWTCSGRQVALYELNKTVFELMRTFDFQVVNPKHAWDELNFVAPHLSNMHVRISKADLEAYR